MQLVFVDTDMGWGECEGSLEGSWLDLKEVPTAQPEGSGVGGSPVHGQADMTMGRAEKVFMQIQAVAAVLALTV